MEHEFLNEVIRLTVKVILLLGRCILYYAATIPIFAIASVLQERKIWKATKSPLTLWGLFKIFIFNVFWMLSIGIAALALVPMWISRGCGSSVSLEQNAVMEKLVAIGLLNVFVGTVKVVNEDKIPELSIYPSTKPAPVFIANHCSQLDISAVYFIIKRFKWIAKDSVKFLPGVGQGMILGAHIFIKRTGKNGKSISTLYEQSNATIQAGVPMMLFPQGTRRMAERLPFKDGAFKIAIANEVPIVPLSIDIPVNVWNSLYPLSLLWGGKKDENIVSSSSKFKSFGFENCDSILYIQWTFIYLLCKHCFFSYYFHTKNCRSFFHRLLLQYMILLKSRRMRTELN